MTRTSVVFTAGMAVGAGVVYRTFVAGLSAGWDPDARGAVSRTVPPQHIPLREEFHIPLARTEMLPTR
jgi:hypothetical protein